MKYRVRQRQQTLFFPGQIVAKPGFGALMRVAAVYSICVGHSRGYLMYILETVVTSKKYDVSERQMVDDGWHVVQKS